MNKLFFLTLAFLAFTPIFSQVNFKWDVIIDAPELSKNELYSATKMFIAKTWRSANSVIQNDDKETGQILVKGNSLIEKNIFINTHSCGFSYSVTFMFKDGKSRVLIENVFCFRHSVYNSGGVAPYEWAHMPVMDTYPEKGKRMTGINEKNYLEIMTTLKKELQMIIDSYKTAIISTKKTDEW